MRADCVNKNQTIFAKVCAIIMELEVLVNKICELNRAKVNSVDDTVLYNVYLTRSTLLEKTKDMMLAMQEYQFVMFNLLVPR